MTESPKICCEPCLSNFSTIFQKDTDGINEASRLKNDKFTVRPGMLVHVSWRRNYIRTSGVPSSSAEVSYRKTRTSSREDRKDNSERTAFTVVVLLQREKRKLRNQVMSFVGTGRLIKQSIKLSLTEKMVSGPLKL